MAAADALPMKQQSVFASGMAGALRRLFPQRAASQADAGGRYWTQGVTYRGYLGVSGGESASWMTEQQLRETEALLRMAAAAGRLGAWSVELPGHRWVWSDEVKAIHGVPPHYEPETETVLAFCTPESQERAVAAFEACGRDGTGFDIELQRACGRGWIRAIGEAERDAHGRITHLRGALQDISKTKAVTEFPETASGKFMEKCQDALRDGRTVEFTKNYPPLAIWVYFKVWPTDQGLTFLIRDATERIATRRELLSLKSRLAQAAAPA